MLLLLGKNINSHRKTSISGTFVIRVCSCITKVILFMLNIYHMHKNDILSLGPNNMIKGNVPSCFISKDVKIYQSCWCYHTVFKFFPIKFQKIYLPGLRAAFNLPVKNMMDKMGITYISPKPHLLQLLKPIVYFETFKRKCIIENKVHLMSISGNDLCNYTLNKPFWIFNYFLWYRMNFKERRKNLERCPILSGHYLP